jgi:hypothetical protein
MQKQSHGAYADTITRAAMMLLAMSVRREIQPALRDEVVAAVAARGGQIDSGSYFGFDLRVVIEEIVERTMAILSAALRERLPGIADEMDAAFGDDLRALLVSVAQPLPTV